MMMDIAPLSDIEKKEIIKSKAAFTIYKDRLSSVEFMTDEDAGKLLKAIYSDRVLNTTMDLSKENPIVQAAFKYLKDGFTRDDEKYLNTTIRNRQNGQNGGRPKKPIGLSSVLTKSDTNPNKADTETEKDKDRDRDRDINKPPKTNKFKNFDGRKYDYKQLEKEALKQYWLSLKYGSRLYI